LFSLRQQHGIGLRDRYPTEVQSNREKACKDNRRKNQSHQDFSRSSQTSSLTVTNSQCEGVMR
jgi:hypothetical protein